MAARINRPERYITKEQCAASIREFADQIEGDVASLLCHASLNVYWASREDVAAALAKQEKLAAKRASK